MGPGKECCAACDGANVVGCSFKGESECRPLKAKPRTVRTYNPATHVVVSREAGERVAKIIEYDVCGRENCKCGELAAELRAALEEKSC
jgi:hypothetical protein